MKLSNSQQANMRRSRKALVDNANMRRSRKAPVDNAIITQFVRYYSKPHESFELLGKNPELLDSRTIALLGRVARDMLRPTQLDMPSELKRKHAHIIISVAALLVICAITPKSALRVRLENFAGECKKTRRAHSEVVATLYDRIKPKFDYNKVNVELGKMSLKDDEAALAQALQI
ncbi:hypothetical protein BBO_01267 [Beauveria brongniartii RCEF 3172]|uniref:Uncharacterized protein n=1 Tax=Beauveria brongniartii RCEF 3172 TaxID=1081107 RepID=A0A162M5R7_9HYPO|nr:hypothetical protein BBO_01267 [Beauveria brongniartii RCEF 3172]